MSEQKQASIGLIAVAVGMTLASAGMVFPAMLETAQLIGGAWAASWLWWDGLQLAVIGWTCAAVFLFLGCASAWLADAWWEGKATP